jgi:predicted transcriptional regulator
MHTRIFFLHFVFEGCTIKAMKLDAYLKTHNLNHYQFSRLSGIPQPTIWRILNRKVNASPRIAKEIEKSTKGKVTALEVLYG